MESKEERYLRLGMSTGRVKIKLFAPLFGISIIIFLFSFLTTKPIEKYQLKKFENQVIEIPPQHKEYKSGKNGRTYECQIQFKNFKEIFKIERIDYQYVNFERLYKDIKVDDTVSFYAVDNIIYSLEKDGFNYCDLDSANLHKRMNKAYMRWLAAIASFFFGFGLLLDISKKLREYYDRKIKFSWGCLSVGMIIIAFFSVTITIGTQYVTNKYDYDKSYKKILEKYEYKSKSR